MEKNNKEENPYLDGKFNETNRFMGFCPVCADRNINGYIYERDFIRVEVGPIKIFRCLKCKQEINEKELIPF